MPEIRNLMIAASALIDDRGHGRCSRRRSKSRELPAGADGKEFGLRQGDEHAEPDWRQPDHLVLRRPAARVAGNMKTSAFVPFWSQGTDSFAKDPPNADISIVEGDVMRQVVVELQDPILDGDVLRYRVKTLQGEIPETGTDVSLFIDVIGMPWTPVSYAGVARRSYRRAWYR